MTFKNTTRYLTAVCLLTVSQCVRAQETQLFQDSHSPLETQYNTVDGCWELKIRDLLLSNPAVMRQSMAARRSFFNDNPEATVKTFPLTVEANASGGKMLGDCLPTEGNQFDDVSLVANGVIKGKKSMLYGKASFTTGNHKNINWNILRSPETYWPYVVADSTGGNMSYETYNLLCAYSFRLNRQFDLGVSGEYKGDYAWRKTDPRIQDITSWLTLKTGAACTLSQGHRLAFDVNYQLHRQNSEVKHFRSGQFAGFFMEYGFGMYDYIHSPIYNSMKNQTHQHTWQADLQFLSAPTRPMRLTAVASYGKDIMTTEENIYKLNLYRAETDRLKLAFSAMWNNALWGVSLTGNADASRRKGRENVFERYVSATVDGVDVYDYRKIGQQDRYSLQQVRCGAQLKLSRYLAATTTLSLFGSADWYRREEKYSETGYHILNVLLTPRVGMEMKHTFKSLEFRLTGAYGRTSVPQHEYEVGVDMKRHTEFQHAFSPYAYYAYRGDRVSVDAEVSHVFSFARIGIRGQWLYLQGHRLDDVSYDSDRYNSQVPSARKYTVSPQPDRHNQHWLKVAVFAEF